MSELPAGGNPTISGTLPRQSECIPPYACTELSDDTLTRYTEDEGQPLYAISRPQGYTISLGSEINPQVVSATHTSLAQTQVEPNTKADRVIHVECIIRIRAQGPLHLTHITDSPLVSEGGSSPKDVRPGSGDEVGAIAETCIVVGCNGTVLRAGIVSTCGARDGTQVLCPNRVGARCPTSNDRVAECRGI